MLIEPRLHSSARVARELSPGAGAIRLQLRLVRDAREPPPDVPLHYGERWMHE